MSYVNCRSSSYINCLQDIFLSQVVHESIRHTALLGLILTNDEYLVDEVLNLGINNQNIIRFGMNVIARPNLQINMKKNHRFLYL